MTWAESAMWGLFGGFAVQGLEFVAAIYKPPAGWPWNRPEHPGVGPYVAALLVRLFVGSGLAVAASSADPSIGAMTALTVGVAAPLIINRLAAQVPLEESTSPTTTPVSTVAHGPMVEARDEG